MWYIYLQHRTHAIRECIMFTFMCYHSILMKYVIVMWAKHIFLFSANKMQQEKNRKAEKINVTYKCCFSGQAWWRMGINQFWSKKVCLQQNLKIKSQMSKTWKSILAKRSNLKVLRLWKYLGLEIKSQQKRGRDKSGDEATFKLGNNYLSCVNIMVRKYRNMEV